MILIISTCAEKLHELEFVKPVFEIIKKSSDDKRKNVIIKHYNKITNEDINNADKIIICGTSLKDNEFLKDIKKFQWIKSYKKPILGICSGAHIIGLVFRKKIKKKKAIGLKEIDIKEEFLGIKGKRQVYHLHNLQVLPETFHKKNLYAILFHPEVRNREMIEGFLKV